MPILDADFVKRLDRLDLVSRRILAGRMKGERRTKRRGESIEFADYRDYAAGDDLRRLDWNVFARLDKLFLKLFMEEEDLSVYVLLDASASMRFGDPDKLEFGKKIAAALGYIGLARGNRVVATAFAGAPKQGEEPPAGGAGEPPKGPGAIRGKGGAPRLFTYLEGVEPKGATDLGTAFRRFSIENPRAGIAVVISDLLDRAGLDEALRFLQARRMEIFVVHVLSPGELEPEMAGELRLIDVESRERIEVTASWPLMKQYKKTLERFLGLTKEACVKRGMGYVLVSTAQPFDELVLRWLRDRGLVK